MQWFWLVQNIKPWSILTNNLSTTKSMYWLIRLEFIPTRSHGRASHTSSLSISTTSQTILLTLSSLSMLFIRIQNPSQCSYFGCHLNPSHIDNRKITSIDIIPVEKACKVTVETFISWFRCLYLMSWNSGHVSWFHWRVPKEGYSHDEGMSDWFRKKGDQWNEICNKIHLLDSTIVQSGNQRCILSGCLEFVPHW